MNKGFLAVAVLLILLAPACGPAPVTAPTGMPPTNTIGPAFFMGGGSTLPPPPVVDKPIPVAEHKAALTADNTRVEFIGKKPDGQHQGGFRTLTGTAELTPDDTAVRRIAVEIETDSLWADNPMLAGHLKSPDFFGVKTYPKASFEAAEIKPAAGGAGTHAIAGELTLHGVTRKITCPATITLKDRTLAIKSTFTINRQDFKISFDRQPVNDEVEVTVRVGVAPK
jgi:polyisoprenoid-binding protein YceI